MNILLLEGLPEEYEGYQLSADFRNMINVELIFADTSVPEHQRLMLAFNNLYPSVPEDIKVALNGLMWFYGQGHVSESQEEKTQAGRKTSKGYDYEQDADYIYSSFCTAYGIRLAEVEFMHWWEFLALFRGLPDDTIMKRIIYWRTCDLSKLPKEEKKHVIRMRGMFSLRKKETERRLTLDELNKKTQEYYDARIRGET